MAGCGLLAGLGGRLGGGHELPRPGSIPGIVDRPAVLLRPVPVRLGLEGLEDLRPAIQAEVAQPVRRSPQVGDLAARHQDEHPVADAQVGDAVRDHDDRPPVLGQAGHHLHHGLVQAGVQAGRGLVEEQQRRFGEQLERDIDALLLAAGQRRRARLGVLPKRQLAQHLVDPAGPFGRAGVPGEPELGRVSQRAARGQLGVQDVVLGHQADPVPQLRVVGVQVAAVVQDRARGGRPHPGQGAEQGRLARAARPDHAEQAALGEREADLVEEDLAAGQGDGQLLGVERDVAGVVELLELVADEAEGGEADADDVGLGEDGAFDPLAVDERAVVAALVRDLVSAAR